MGSVCIVVVLRRRGIRCFWGSPGKSTLCAEQGANDCDILQKFFEPAAINTHHAAHHFKSNYR